MGDRVALGATGTWPVLVDNLAVTLRKEISSFFCYILRQCNVYWANLIVHICLDLRQSITRFVVYGKLDAANDKNIHNVAC